MRNGMLFVNRGHLVSFIATSPCPQGAPTNVGLFLNNLPQDFDETNQIFTPSLFFTFMLLVLMINFSRIESM